MDITSERNIQGTDSSLQDGDHTDGYFITLFAEQLTRPFEVLVFNLFNHFPTLSVHLEEYSPMCAHN